MKHQTWPTVALGSRTKFLSGGTPSKSEDRYWNGDIPWIGSGEMSEQRVHETAHAVTYDGARNGTRLVPRNTVLVVVRGMSLAKECRVSLTTRESTFNQDVKALNLSSSVDPVFVFYYLRSQRFTLRDAASEAAHGTKKLDMPVLEQWPFPDVPFPIQRKIAAILTTYDDLIETNKRRIALLEKMAEELYREWFVRMRFPGHKNTKFVKGVPDGWEVKRISEVYQTASGGTPSRKVPEYFGGDIQWLKTGELKELFTPESEEHITRSGLENSAATVFPAKTVIMAMYCAMPDISIATHDTATNQACCAFLPKSDWLHYGFNYFLLREAQKHLVMFAHGAAQQNLSQEIIRRFQVLLPPKSLVEGFGNVVEPLLLMIREVSASHRVLSETRDLLLPRLISGKLSVNDLDVQFPLSMQDKVSEPEAAHA